MKIIYQTILEEIDNAIFHAENNMKKISRVELNPLEWIDFRCCIMKVLDMESATSAFAAGYLKEYTYHGVRVVKVTD